MATIDIKLKSYDELVFEITKLNTDIYLKDTEIKDLQTRINKAIEYITQEHFKREQLGITNLSFSEKELNILLDILKGE